MGLFPCVADRALAFNKWRRPTRTLTSSPGRYSGQDNGWALALLEPVIVEFDKTIMKFPNTKRLSVRSNDLVPNLQNPDNPVPLLKEQIEQQGEPHVGGGGG